MLWLTLAIAAEPLFWADPNELFPGQQRHRVQLDNPTTALAVLKLDEHAIAEVPPRGTVDLTLPPATYTVTWTIEPGTVHHRPDLVITR